MSTRTTLASGEWGHMWADFTDDEPTMHVELNTLARVHFVAEPLSITVSIPAKLWDEIRRVASIDLTWRDDAEGEVSQ